MKRQITKDNLLELLLHGTEKDVRDTIDTIHPVDILDLIHEEPQHATAILNRLPDDILADIVEEEEDEDKYALLKQFSDTRQKHILEEMSSDEITDLIGELEEAEADEVLNKMDREDRDDVKKLLEFEPDTAGGIMKTEYIRIFAKNTVKDTLEFLQKNTDEETTYYLYVVDKENVLKGVVSLRDIVTSSFDTPMLSITNPNVISLRYDEDQEQVAHTFEKYGFILMPVVDEEHRMLGVIEFDDIMDVIQEENTEDIHHLGGVNSEERVDSTLKESFSSRIPWLIVNLFTAVLAAATVSMFEATISKVVALATIMPIVTGMGGNAGTQSLTIVVRGLSLGQLTKENAIKILLKEIGVGILSGVVIGGIVAIGAMWMESNPVFGMVTGIAMFLNMILANFAGYFIPVILEKFHVDPALASGVFVTTVTDVMGFFLFLGLATMVLPMIL
ncbi:magnesium transporter [[Eubacterium] hominis]|uniref:magnesium transporter n=1 Tax=[Eubacterium] hominis TaxID=2764325 RepID=UPI003A4D766A